MELLFLTDNSNAEFHRNTISVSNSNDTLSVYMFKSRSSSSSALAQKVPSCEDQH